MRDSTTKSHKGDLNDTEDNRQGGRIYQTNDVPRPYAVFVKYSRTSLSQTRLFRITAYLEVKIWSLF